MTLNPYAAGQSGDPASTGFDSPKFMTAVRTMQIVTVAMSMGILTTIFVVLVITSGNLSGQMQLLTMIGIGFGLLMVANHFVIPGLIAKNQLKQAFEEGLLEKERDEQLNRCSGIFSTQLIIGLALLEGAAVFNLIAMLVDHSPISLTIAAILLGLMLVRFPTHERVSWWVQDKLRELSFR